MEFEGWHVLEAVAAVGNLAYTLLMLYEKRIGWIFGLVASLLGAALFMHQHVYAQAALSMYYVVMAVYGWWSWGRPGANELPISRRRLPFHVVLILIGLAVAVVFSFGLQLLPGSQLTELDGFVTAFSLLATWMLARKILENWTYWIVTDIAAIVLYYMLGLYWYAGLYAVYVLISASALVRWTRTWRSQRG